MKGLEVCDWALLEHVPIGNILFSIIYLPRQTIKVESDRQTDRQADRQAD